MQIEGILISIMMLITSLFMIFSPTKVLQLLAPNREDQHAGIEKTLITIGIVGLVMSLLTLFTSTGLLSLFLLWIDSLSAT